MSGIGFRCVVTGTCSLTAISNTAYITFSTLAFYNVTGGGTICSGSPVAVGLNGSTSGIQYKLYLNGTYLTPPVTGTGSAISFGSYSSGGTYTVKGVTTDGCEVLMNGSAVITLRTVSTAATSISATLTALCPGSSSTLSVNGGVLGEGASWHWYTGGCGTTSLGTGTSITVTPAITTTYYVRAEGTCNTTSCVSVTVNVKALPSITTQPSNSTVVLGNNASFSVTANGPNLQYQWQSSPTGVDSWTNLTGLPAIGYQTSTLTIQGSTTFVDNYYRCQISSDCNTVYSNNVKIILLFPVSGYLTGSDIPDPETRTLNTSYLAGATNGSFNINPLGGASYSIPLQLPQGVNGLAPRLTMTYSSNGGAGIPGFGWQIDGISTISLGPRTAYNDYRADGTFDRFYLDGQRLVPNISSSAYGASGTQYQTENDIFTRVTPELTDPNYGPSWFRAETKSGLVYEYGNSPASKQQINPNSRVLNWYVSKISDLFSNQINFAYIQDHYSVYPSEITYGPNDIIFYYKQRNTSVALFLD
jgi:hypothetical protein